MDNLHEFMRICNGLLSEPVNQNLIKAAVDLIGNSRVIRLYGNSTDLHYAERFAQFLREKGYVPMVYDDMNELLSCQKWNGDCVILFVTTKAAHKVRQLIQMLPLCWKLIVFSLGDSAFQENKEWMEGQNRVEFVIQKKKEIKNGNAGGFVDLSVLIICNNIFTNMDSFCE